VRIGVVVVATMALAGCESSAVVLVLLLVEAADVFLDHPPAVLHHEVADGAGEGELRLCLYRVPGPSLGSFSGPNFAIGTGNPVFWSFSEPSSHFGFSSFIAVRCASLGATAEGFAVATVAAGSSSNLVSSADSSQAVDKKRNVTSGNEMTLSRDLERTGLGPQ
jgi:hypothetical protein